MEISESILQILAILTRTGFADLAAELRRSIEAGQPNRELPGEEWLQSRAAAEAPEQPFRAYTHEEQAQLIIQGLKSQLVDPAFRVAEAEDLAAGIMDRGFLEIVLVESAFGEPRRTSAREAMGFEAAERLRALLPTLLEAIMADGPQESI